MTQKLIGDILYVFKTTPYQITQDTDAEVIKVQEECVAGFKELNESLADKIVAYNYHVICANVPEWAPYVDEPDQTPQKLYVMNVDEDYGFYGTYTLIVNDGAPAAGTFETSVTSGDTIKLYFGNITKEQFEEQVVMTKCELDHGASTFEPTLKSDDEHYYYEFTMPAGTLGFFFRLNWYHFEVAVNQDGVNLANKTTNYIDGVDINDNIANNLHKGQTVKIVPVDDPSYYTLTGGNVSWDSEQGAWTGTIRNDLYVTIIYADPATFKSFTLYPGAERRKVIVNFSDGQTHEAIVDDSHMPGMNDPINIAGYGQYEGYVYTYTVPENTEITLVPTEWIENYTYDNVEYSYDSQTNSLTPSIVMDADKAVYFVYTAPKQDPELDWSTYEATVTLGASDNVFPTLSNPHNVSPITYSSDDPTIATVDEYGNVTLLSVGTTFIQADFAGDGTYEEGGVEYSLQVEDNVE